MNREKGRGRGRKRDKMKRDLHERRVRDKSRCLFAILEKTRRDSRVIPLQAARLLESYLSFSSTFTFSSTFFAQRLIKQHDLALLSFSSTILNSPPPMPRLRDDVQRKRERTCSARRFTVVGISGSSLDRNPRTSEPSVSLRLTFYRALPRAPFRV